MNISLVFITQSYFSVPEEARSNSTHYLIMKINNRKDLQQTSIDHSADIDYNDFLKIYRNCAKEPYSFLLLILQSYHEIQKEFFRFSFIKMTLTEHVKILDDKIRENKAQ